LASSSIAYLPYPDGVSERRASFKAVLLNGVTTITTRGQHTPFNLEGLVSFCATPEDALAAVHFLAENGEHRTLLADKARQYALQFTWERIAEAHIELYKSVISLRRSDTLVPANSPDLEN